MDGVVLDFKLEAKTANKQLKELNANVKKVGEQVSTTRLAIANAFGSAIVGSIKAVTGAIVSSIGSIASKTIELEQLTTQFEVLTNSTEDAKKIMSDLQKFAASTPFQLPGIAKVSAQLLAFGFNQDQLIPKLKELGDVAAASGSDLADIGLIFGQISAAGKLTGERLLQIQERGIPIGPALAKTMGVAETAIKDLVSKGAVDFATFEQAFGSLNKVGGFAFKGMIKQSKTLGGVLSTLGDNFSLLQTEIGTEFLPIAKQLGVALITLIQNNLELIKSLARLMADGIKVVIDGFITLGKHLYDNAAIYKPIAVGIGIVGLALVALGVKAIIASISFTTLATTAAAAWIAITGPVGLVILAIAAVGAAAYALWENWDQVVAWITTKAHEMAATFKDVAAKILETISPIEPAFRLVFSSLIKIWAYTTGTIIQGAIDVAGVLGGVFGLKLPDSIKNFKSNLLESAEAMKNGGGTAEKLAKSLREGAQASRDSATAVKVASVAIEENTKKTNKNAASKKTAADQQRKIELKAEEDRKKIDADLKALKDAQKLIEAEEKLVVQKLEDAEAEAKLTKIQDLHTREQEIKIQAAKNVGASAKELEILKTKFEIDNSKTRLANARKETKEKRKIANQQVANYRQGRVAEVKWEKLTLEQKKGYVVQSLTSLSNLQNSSNKAAFAVGKSAAIANAIITTYQGATAAYTAMVGIPFVGPVLAAIAAATAVAGGLANVSKIRAQKPPAASTFATGGVVTGPGTSTSDSIPAFLSNNETVLNGRQQANTLMAIAEGGNNNNNDGLLNAIHGLGDRIANMEIVLQTSDYEIGRSVQRSLDDGLTFSNS